MAPLRGCASWALLLLCSALPHPAAGLRFIAAPLLAISPVSHLVLHLTAHFLALRSLCRRFLVNKRVPAVHGHNGCHCTAAQQVRCPSCMHQGLASSNHHLSWRNGLATAGAAAAAPSPRGHEVLVLVTPAALDFVKTAAARHNSNTPAEGLTYLLVDVHYREFEKPKALKPGEVPKPSMFASRYTCDPPSSLGHHQTARHCLFVGRQTAARFT